MMSPGSGGWPGSGGRVRVGSGGRVQLSLRISLRLINIPGVLLQKLKIIEILFYLLSVCLLAYFNTEIRLTL